MDQEHQPESPAGASASPVSAAPLVSPGPVLPEEVSRELSRVARRWRQLPVDHASRCSGSVRELAQRLADQTAERLGRGPEPLPDLGPVVLLDQLRVVVYDACRLASYPGSDVAAALATLRRSLS